MATRPSGRAAQMRAGAGEPDFHHASMDTGHFSFDGYGRTPDEARAAVKKGFRNHLKQSGGSMAQWRQETGHKDLDDYYGINVQPAWVGGAVRDRDSQLNGHPG